MWAVLMCGNDVRHWCVDLHDTKGLWIGRFVVDFWDGRQNSVMVVRSSRRLVWRVWRKAALATG